MARASSRARPRASAPAPTDRPAERHLRTSLAALRLGATSAAILGGVGCSLWLAQLGVPTPLAGGIGLLFALIGRAAMASLGYEWLVRSAERHRANPTPPPSPPPRASPPPRRR
ncbi:MAG: hypothetical protein IVW57_06425 [Ktedonobacterales bacterium]|nr:hypothetical protein [Ktedonobacterales bacterium]